MSDAADALEDARRLVGVPLRRSRHQWHTAASADAVRHYAWGIGDENPLFCDPSYGRRSRWGAGLAPGCFLYAVDDTVVAPGLPGVQWFYLGSEWEFHRAVRHGDAILARATLLDAELRSGRRAGHYVVQTGEVTYTDDGGRPLARAVSHTARIPRRPTASTGLRYEPREPYVYSDEELDAIAQAVEGERVRGAAPRWWEDVVPGDEVTPVVKGPLGMGDMLAYACGAGTIHQAHERAWRYRAAHPADAVRDPRTNAPDHPALSHHDRARALSVGMPGQYDVGMQRIAWIGHLLTNWCGDGGHVARLAVDLLSPNPFGDTTWCRGRVTGKVGPDQEGRRSVTCEVWTVNQCGDVATRGTATVVLPARAEHTG